MAGTRHRRNRPAGSDRTRPRTGRASRETGACDRSYCLERRVDWEGSMQGAQLRYTIKFVADMDKAVKSIAICGLTLKFESPGWSEFVTGETTLALHPASHKNPAGKVELGFNVADVE